MRLLNILSATIFPIIGLALLGAVSYQNWHVPVELTYGAESLTGVSLGMIILLTGLLGMGISFQRLSGMNLRLRQQIKHYEHRRDKAEVTAEASSDQVRALQAKIDTLEKALDRALSQSTKK